MIKTNKPAAAKPATAIDAKAAKVLAAQQEAEQRIYLGAYASTVSNAVTRANRAFVAVTETVIAATIELASYEIFKNAIPADFDKKIRPILKAALEPLMGVSAGTIAVYITGARNLFLAVCNGIDVGDVKLSQADWNKGIVAALQATGVMPAPKVETNAKGETVTVKGRGRPAKQGAGKTTAPAASAATIAPLKVVTPQALQDMLRLAGMGDHSETLAHMIINERPVLVKWLNTIAA